EAFLYMNLASVEIKRQQWDQAIKYLTQCRELCARIDAEDFLAEAYRHLAEAYLGLGQTDQAEEWAKKSLELASAQEMKLEEGMTRKVMGQIHRARSDWDVAERELRAGLTILEALDSQYQVGQTLFQLAQLYRDLGHDGSFRETIHRAIVIFAGLGAQLDLERSRALAS
ncbi:MAG: tetratricopeptide repeat protein, partial [Chloroflexota bacterium]|nr:tetratricopeptide repeat protein [Chloroflexota bacterium]